MTDTPYTKFEEGKLWSLCGGKYVEDQFGLGTIMLLAHLKSLPVEYRTHQDNRFIQEIQDALKERRDWERERER